MANKLTNPQLINLNAGNNPVRFTFTGVIAISQLEMKLFPTYNANPNDTLELFYNGQPLTIPINISGLSPMFRLQDYILPQHLIYQTGHVDVLIKSNNANAQCVGMILMSGVCTPRTVSGTNNFSNLNVYTLGINPYIPMAGLEITIENPQLVSLDINCTVFYNKLSNPLNTLQNIYNYECRNATQTFGFSDVLLERHFIQADFRVKQPVNVPVKITIAENYK